MIAGELYIAGDPELVAEREACERRLQEFNASGDQQLIQDVLGELGADAHIRAPFHCDYGYNIRVGAATFVNFGCVMLDVVPITIGARVQIASGVQLLAADHPLDAVERASGRESGAPITVGDDVWLGGGAILCPGVSVGPRTVVGAGAIVTSDLPADVVAVGNPARVVREL